MTPTTPNEREDWEKWVKVLSNSTNPRDKELLVVKIELLLSRTRQEEREKVEKLSGALMNMYEQYCAGGHAFMNAGEDASAVLEEYGYATFDSTGRLLEQARNLT